jgi:Ser/Thr protein kinase RdoA (MazF antagonist)
MASFDRRGRAIVDAVATQLCYEAIGAATIEGYRCERALTDADLALLPTFLAARKPTPMLFELACGVAREYLASR